LPTLRNVDLGLDGSSYPRQRPEEELMRYLLLVCVDPTIDPEEPAGAIDGWLDRVREARLVGNRLRDPDTAATVRVRRSERLVTDGPFAETKRFVAGFDIIDCQTREEAIEIAAAHPVATFGAVELREFWSEDGA
jgi:hypothetical protein